MNNEDLRKELAANGIKAALRFLSHHMDVDVSVVKSRICHELGIDRQTIHNWQARGVDDTYVPFILKMLNSIRHVWSYHQLAPRQREVEIWKRMAVHGRFNS